MVDIGGIGSDGSTWTRNHRFGIAGCNSFLNECGGNVGIGITTPKSKLHVSSTSNFEAILKISDITTESTGILALGDGGTSTINVGIWRAAANSMSCYGNWLNLGGYDGILFATCATGIGSQAERMRITSGGYVGIGNTSPVSRLTVNNAVVGATLPYINSTSLSYNSEGISVAGSNTANANVGNGLTLYNNVASVGAYSPVIAFSSMTSGGAYNATYAFISGVYRGAGGDANWGIGDLIFGTGASYGATLRMTISSAGNIGAPSGTNIYNASDARLKQNVTTITNGLDKVMGLNPVKFNWINNFVESEEGKDMLGFVAQEVQTIIPEAVENFSNNSITVGETTIENPLRVNEKFIIPVLVKAIQEQQCTINTLKSCIGIV